MISEDDELPNDQQEGLEDLAESGRRYEAVINQADWTVQTILQQIDRGNIELNPDFQRREAWRKDRKSQYIESLIINVPVPQIVLAERKDKRGKFVVIDGKQRLLSLRQFHATSDDSIFDSFRLEKLSIRTDLNGIDHEELSTNPSLESDFDALENSTIRTAVIRNWDDENFLYTVFLRLNTGSVPLSPQELGQALHPGEFVKFVDTYSAESDLLRHVLRLSKPDPRMRDAELVIRYFAFRNFLQTYTGNLKPLLDETANYFNSVWSTQQDLILSQKNDFEAAITATIDIFGANAFRKWNGVKYERSLNRAVFDVMVYYFAASTTRDSAIQKGEQVEGKFKQLCESNEFRNAIEGTTKSIDAIYGRLSGWGEALRQLGIPAVVPHLVENRIIRSA